MKKIFIILLSLFFLTGCTDYIELENLGITSSLFITYDTEYHIIAEIIKDEEMEYIETNGDTISDAIHNFTFKSKSEIYLSHLNAVIIDRNVNLDDLIFYFLRNPNNNSNFYITITDAKDFYKKEENIGMTIKNILERLNRDDFFTTAKKYLNENHDIVLPYMKDPLNIDTLFTYKDKKIINNLDKQETLIYSLLTKSSKEETFKFKVDDYDLVLSINQIISKINVDKIVQVCLDIETTILEKDENLDTSKIDTITYVEKSVSKTMERKVSKFFETIKMDKTDILGIDTLINNKYKKIDKHFYDYNYDVTVHININKKGQLLK